MLGSPTDENVVIICVLSKFRSPQNISWASQRETAFDGHWFYKTVKQLKKNKT